MSVNDGASELAARVELAARNALGDARIRVRLSPAWGGRAPNHRHELRADILRELTAAARAPASPSAEDAAPPRLQNLMDLSRPPHADGFGLSVSHTLDLGGYAWLPEQRRLGLDIESGARVRPEIARRVSAPSEFDEAPSPAHLWCAKESAYKCLLGDDQPRVISDLEVRGWTAVRQGLFLFRAIRVDKNQSVPGTGCLYQDDSLYFALFLQSSST